jgi:hypothetical protein|nr:MAG TPA: hypothetical protein [Caudoviricetes sp.]
MRYIYVDISHFLHKSIKGGTRMTQIHCDRKHCLNNDKHGICTAKTIEYNGRCQTYITHSSASKNKCGLCVRSHGKLKRKGGEVLK